MTTLSDLILKLEGATGGSRELDYAITEAVMDGWHERNGYTREPNSDNGWYSSTPPVAGCEQVAPAQFYTASIDAAMTLVPEGLGWEVCYFGAEVFTKEEAAKEVIGIGVVHDIPAIALCIASLRARLATNPDSEEDVG